MRLFNATDVIGEEIWVNDNLPLVVTGIYEKPKQVSVAYDIIIAGDSHLFWGSQVFVRLENVDIERFEALVNLRSKHYWAWHYKNWNSALMEAFFQPLSEVHFESFELEPLTSTTFPKRVIWFLMIVGVVIMGVAWINTLNLSLAQNTRRTKEIYIRKVIGASQKRLFVQGMFEFFLSSSLALLIALSLTQVLYPALSAMDLDFAPTYLMSKPLFWTAIIVSMALVSATSAFLQQKFSNHARSLTRWPSQKPLSATGRIKRPQHLLIVAQFMCTSGLLVAVTVISNQVDFILGQDLGFNPEQVLLIPAPYNEQDKDPDKMDRFLLQVQGMSGAEATSSLTYPSHSAKNIGFAYKAGQSQSFGVQSNGLVSDNFIEFYGIEMLAGTSFHDHPGEPNTMLISRRMAEGEYGSIENALNQSLIWHHYSLVDSSTHIKYRIVGVYDDYEMQAFNQIQDPRGTLLIKYPEHPINGISDRFFSVRFQSDTDRNKIGEIRQMYESTFPNSSFEHFRFEDQILSRYANEKLVQTVVGGLTILSIIVSTLGLVALISLSLAHRVKEIGIRRVLGASFTQIFHGLSFHYLKLILMASILSAPIVLYYAREWLNGFSIRIQVTWIMVLAPVIVVVALVFLILIVQVKKSVSTNPVESLRYE